MKPRTRTRRRVLVALVAIAVLLGAAALAAWATFPPERLTPLIQRGLAQSLNAPVGLGRAQLRLFPPIGVRLERLTIGDPRGYMRPAAWPRGGVATARTVDAGLDPWALLSRRLRLTSFTLQDARVTLVRNEAGIGNWEGLATAKPARAPSSAFDLTLDRFTIANARVSSYDGRDGAWFDVRRLDAQLALRTGSGGRDRRVRLEARAIGLGGRTPWPIGARPIELSADLESQQAGRLWLLRRVALARGDFKVSGHGTVTGPEQVLDFALDQASVPLDALLEFVPREETKSLGTLEGRGDVHIALQAKGPMAKGRMPSVRARAQLKDGRLAFGQRQVAIEGLAFDVTGTEQGADLARLEGKVGRSVFEVSGLLRSWTEPRVRAHVKAHADLSDVARFLPLADSTRLAGRVALDADGAGTPGPEFGWSGKVVLADVSASGVGTGFPITGVTGTLDLSPGRASARGLRAQLGRSDVGLDATIDRPFAFLAQALGNARTHDPNALMRFALVSRSIDGDQLFPARADSSALPRVRAEGTFRIGALTMQRFAGRDLAGSVIYQDGVMRIDDCALTAYDGRVRGNAWFDLSNRASPRYQVHATAEQVDANRLLSAWTPVKDVAFGALEMKLDLDGSGFTPADVARGLSASGLARVLGGRLAGAPVFAKLAEFTGVDRFRILSFRDLSAPFRVSHGRVVFDPIALASGATDWLAQGSVGLDGTLAFHVAALVPATEIVRLPTALTRVAGALLDPDGRLTLDFALEGTVSRPKFGWDSDRTASRLVARGEESLAALTESLTGALADTLAASRKAIEDRAAAALAEQRRRLEAELERRKQEAGNQALDELDRLFRAKSPPPPPPDTSAAADTARATAPVPAAPSPEPAPPSAPDTSARAGGA